MPPKDRAALGLAVYAGLRLGELLALDVGAVDLDDGWIYVRRSWDPGVKEFAPTKSRKGAASADHRQAARAACRPSCLSEPPNVGLLFPNAQQRMRPTDPAILRRRTHKRWEDAGLTRLGFHEGRHTFASIAIAADSTPRR